MKVVYFQRKPVPGRYFSIENYFDAVRSALPATVESHVAVCRYISQGLWKRVYNVWEAWLRQGDVNHVTGDIHYINILFSTRKTILTIHDCGFMHGKGKLARAVLKFFWLTLPSRKAAYITCISHATREELLQYVRKDPSRIWVIPTAISPIFKPYPKLFNTHKPHILQVGTTANKNIERVAEALRGIPCRLSILGPVSDSQQAALSVNGIEYNAESGISTEKVLQKYQACDMLVFASTFEGFGMPILEANCVERPVVTSSISSMPEVAGDAACLVDPFDVSSIRAGVLKIITDDAYRNQLIENGRKNRVRFSAIHIAQQYCQLYTLCHTSTN